MSSIYVDKIINKNAVYSNCKLNDIKIKRYKTKINSEYTISIGNFINRKNRKNKCC